MFKNNSTFGLAILLSSVLTGILSSAYAQQVQDVEAMRNADELIQDFIPQPKPRGIGLGIGARALILRKVQFDSNSFRLTAEAKEQLRQLAEAWNSGQLKSYKYRIEGHTDSRGSAERNMVLSEQRAESVKNFLVKEGVDSARLVAIGKGEEEPLDPEDPESGINRRVVFIGQ